MRRTENLEMESGRNQDNVYVNSSDFRAQRIENRTKPEEPPAAKNTQGWLKITLVVLLILMFLMLVIFPSLLFAIYNNITEQQSHLKNNDKNFTEVVSHLGINVKDLASQLETYKKETTFLSSEIQKISGALDKVTEEVQKIKSSPYPTCSAGWTQYGLSCYYLSSDSQQWHASEKNCVDKNAHLVVINGEDEREFLSVMSQNKVLWIGLTKLDGEWKWVDGTPYDITPKFWDKGQPDDWKGRGLGGGEDCGQIQNRKYWNDCHCAEKYQYICEKKIF